MTVYKGVHMVCPNDDCPAKQVGSVDHFVIKCGIKGASETSFKNWNIYSISDLINFTPVGRAAEKFYDNFERIVFSTPKEELIGKFNYTGAGETLIQKYITEIGLTNFIKAAKLNKINSHPVGCGDLTWEKIVAKFDKNYSDYKLIIDDPRYAPIVKEVQETTNELAGKSFCCTGKVTRPRKAIEADIINAGGSIKSVNKSLDYLVAGDKAGSKLAKAEKLGIKVITESELMEMLNA